MHIAQYGALRSLKIRFARKWHSSLRDSPAQKLFDFLDFKIHLILLTWSPVVENQNNWTDIGDSMKSNKEAIIHLKCDAAGKIVHLENHHRKHFPAFESETPRKMPYSENCSADCNFRVTDDLSGSPTKRIIFGYAR